MTRLLHLTDLHFGAERQDLIKPLCDAIQEAEPDMIAVSGDLTHRARPDQFRAALHFLESLGQPLVTAPGNHDIPLWNIGLRVFAPFQRWLEGVPEQFRQGETRLGDFRLFTANTGDPARIRPGVLRGNDVRRISAALQAGDKASLNVLVCHHPIEEPLGFNRGETRNAAAGIEQLVQNGLDLTLSGHLHHWQIGLGVTEDNVRPLLQIQSGTALCARPGEKGHGFSLIESHAGGVTVTPRMIDEGVKRFVPAGAVTFRRGEGGWRRVSP